jgi:hypothetical protein
MKLFILSIALFVCCGAKGQVPDTGMCAKAPVINIYSTVSGYSYLDMVHIHKDTLAQGFEVMVNGPSYRVIGFRVYFFGKYMDLYWKDIIGNRATKENLPILKNLHGDEWMEIECISVIKNKQTFKTRSFKVWVDEK